MDRVLEIARDNNLKVVEDCAHALGADYKNKKVGSLGNVGAFTFAMAKNMPCFGGGMLTVSDKDQYDRMLEMVHPPQSNRYKGLWKEIIKTSVNYFSTLPFVFPYVIYPVMKGLHSLGSHAFDSEPGQETVTSSDVQKVYATHITNLQAAVGLHQLTRIDSINEKVNRNAMIYNRELQNVPGIKPPTVSSDRSHTFLYYRLEVENRQFLRSRLFPKGVDTNPDDMSNCLTLPPFAGYEADIPVAQHLPHKILEIPSNPRMTEEDVLYVARAIRDAVSRT
jgi:dTDP-4-amino-4,6-dideoxygalactose transaminase